MNDRIYMCKTTSELFYIGFYLGGWKFLVNKKGYYKKEAFCNLDKKYQYIGEL